jgi:hypothetical protein
MNEDVVETSPMACEGFFDLCLAPCLQEDLWDSFLMTEKEFKFTIRDFSGLRWIYCPPELITGEVDTLEWQGFSF